MSHRLTRKDIKRDEVMEGLSRVAHFIGENARALGIGIASILVVAAGVAIWQAVSSSREAKANESLSQALKPASEPDAELSAAQEGLVGVAERYGGTRAGSVAYVYLGTIAAEAGDFDLAREHWQSFLDRHDDDALAAGVERNLISLDRAEGKSEELAERLRAALATGGSALGEDSMLYELARTLEELGQNEGALEIYARIVEEYPASIYAGQARERTTALEAS